MGSILPQLLPRPQLDERPTLTIGVTIHWSANQETFSDSALSVLESIQEARRRGRQERIEIIVAFDAAPAPGLPNDNSEVIKGVIRSLDDKVPGVTIVLIESRTNQGVNTMRNWILLNSSSERLMFFDGDDRLLRDGVVIALEAIAVRVEDIISFLCRFQNRGKQLPGDKAVWTRIFKVKSILSKIGTKPFIHRGRSADGHFMQGIRGAGLSETFIGEDMLEYCGARRTQSMGQQSDFPIKLNQVFQATSDMVDIGIELDFRAKISTKKTYNGMTEASFEVAATDNIITAFGCHESQNMGYGGFFLFSPDGQIVKSQHEEEIRPVLHSIIISLIMYPDVLRNERSASIFRHKRNQVMEIVEDEDFAGKFKGKIRDFSFLKFLWDSFKLTIAGGVVDNFCVDSLEGNDLFDNFCAVNARHIARAFKESGKGPRERHHTGEPDKEVFISHISVENAKLRKQGIVRRRIFLPIVSVEERGMRLASGLLHLRRIQRDELECFREESERRIEIYRSVDARYRALLESLSNRIVVRLDGEDAEDTAAQMSKLFSQGMLLHISKTAEDFERLGQQKQSRVTVVEEL
ncbi:MAG: glycosyltransferase family 2 protein [Tannerellaceae bacterium]|jgi:hypothetical protein|nr:glycosyltransferase family 2 protein [Tannerellaceae bacterium]